MTFPCPRCGARADIDCGHRPFDPDWKMPEVKPKRAPGPLPGGGNYRVDASRYKPARGEGNGRNFKTRKRGAYRIDRGDRSK